MPRRKLGTWEGGYIAERRGRPVYVIRRSFGGRDYEISTGASSRRPALDHLARFEADPARYRPGGDPDDAPVYLSAELGVAFLEWSAARNSREWVKEQRRYLAWWAEVLRKVDLRRLHVGREVLPLLDKQTARSQRIAVLKRFCSWLVVERHLLDRDPSAALRVPQARPEQLRRRKDVDQVRLEKTYQELPLYWRDPLDVQLATGWHVRELCRFAQGGQLEQVSDRGRPDVAGELIVLRKAGEVKRTPVGAYALAAALRLRARGGLSISRYSKAIRAASIRASKKLGAWSPGQVRHTVATFARTRAGTKATADFLDHSSESTTKRFYATHAAPPKVPTLR